MFRETQAEEEMRGLQVQTRRKSAADWLAAIADPTRVHILRSLSQHGTATAADLASSAAASHQTLRRHLDALVVTGVLREHPGQSDGETPGRPASRFSLSPETGDSIRQLFGSAP